MYNDNNRNVVPRDSYNRARGRGRLEVFVNTIMYKDGWVATLDKALTPYAYEFEHKPYLIGYVRPQQVIGTISIDRRCCFSKSFLPLPHFDMGDFGYKWTNVLRDVSKWLDYPIECYEFMHRYYVREGNKRVSVSRYLHFPGIKANITRIIPLNIDREDVRCYHEFLAFEKKTGVGALWFSHEGGFTQLTNLLDTNKLSLQELLNIIIPPYVRMTGNYAGPHDAVLSYLQKYPGKNGSPKAHEEAFRRAVREQKNKRNKPMKSEKDTLAGTVEESD